MASNGEQERKPEEKKEEKKEEVKEEKIAGATGEKAEGGSKDEKKEGEKGATSVKENHIISVDPETAYFNPGGGTSDHMIVNTGDRRLAVKIRCSNNALFRVHPVMMFIEPGQCQHMTVTRMAGPGRSDKLVVQYVFCDASDKDVKELYAKMAKETKPDTIRVNLKMMTDKKAKYTSLEVLE